MKLVWDKTNSILALDGLTIVAAPRAHPPFTCQAYVEEQDTQLILAEQTILKDPGKPAWYLAHTLERNAGYSPGEIIIRGKIPLRLLAVVHDLDQEPTCSAESIRQAYRGIMDIAAQGKLTSLALPLLGTVHGRFPATESITLLQDAIRQGHPTQLQRIWLIISEASKDDIRALLSRFRTE